MILRCFWLTVFAVATLAHTSLGQNPVAGSTAREPLDRRRLPAGLQNARLERLSAGALLLLDRDGDLVQPSAAATAREPARRAFPDSTVATAATLDTRVGANTRLGDDPPQLPANLRAQAEPHIARSPVNPDLLAAVFQEGRFTNGGAVDCGYAVSRDGGRTWTRALIPGLTQTSGGPYFRATDPVVAIDSNDRIFLNTEAAKDSAFAQGVILVSRSTDGGNTFSPPVVVYDPGSSGAFPDKPWMAINTFPGTPTAGRIVVTFTLFADPNDPTVTGAPIFLSYSDDAGVTWSPAVSATPPGLEAQGSQPVFLPDGRLALVYWNFGTGAGNPPGERLEVIVSADGGNTFGPVRFIAFATEYNPPEIRSGPFLPSATAARTSGRISVVYQARFNGAPRVLFTQSGDAGATWAAPVAISDDPANTSVFNPAIAASPDGQTLSVSFYDGRVNPGATTLCDIFLAQSFNGGATWQPNIRVTSESTDASLAPRTAQGYMLGDYLGVASPGNAGVPSVPVWIDTRTGNSDPFVARVETHPLFFAGEAALGNAVDYLAFANGNVFGYYTYAYFPYLYHFDLGFEYFIDAQDSARGAYLYDFASNTFFYTSPSFPFPYLYDFSLNAFLYYFPDQNNPGRYTRNPRYFYNFNTGQIITK